MGEDSHMALLGEGIASVIVSRGEQASAFTSNSSIEVEFFSQLLFETNAAQHKLCTAVEELGVLLERVAAAMQICKQVSISPRRRSQ